MIAILLNNLFEKYQEQFNNLTVQQFSNRIMNNNLDDFFNEKLNDLSSSDDGWDEPSASVWANAQPNFPIYGQSKRNWFVVFVVFLGLTLLGTGIYLYKVKQKNNALQQKIAVLNTELEQEKSSNQSLNQDLNRQNQTLQNQVKNLERVLENEQAKTEQTVKNLQNACAVSLNQMIEKNTLPLQNIIQEQQRIIQQLKEENQDLKSTHNAPEQKAIMANKIGKLIDNQAIEANYLLKNKPFLVENNDVKSITSSAITSPKETWKKYELGIDLSSIGFNATLTNSFRNADYQSSPTSNSFFDASTREPMPNYALTNNIPAVGLHFGYGINKDFYIRAGVRYANFELNSAASMEIVYNQSNEYINPQGTVLNDLVVNSTTPFSNIQQGITVEVPSNAALIDGDILQSNLSNFQSYNFWQLPLGIAFYRGKRRLQLEFQGGLTWNHIRFDDYTFDASFVGNNVTLPVNRSNLISNTTNTTSYLGAYLGIGANYKLSDNWQVRAGMTFEETGLTTNTQTLSRGYFLENGMNLSLNYRF